MTLKLSVCQDLPRGRIRYHSFGNIFSFELHRCLVFPIMDSWPAAIFVLFNGQGYSRTRELDSEELLEQLPALQQLLYRLIGCRVFYHMLILQDLSFVISTC